MRFTSFVYLNTIIKCDINLKFHFLYQYFFMEVIYMSQAKFYYYLWLFYTHMWLYNTLFKKTLTTFIVTENPMWTCKIAQPPSIVSLKVQ
jgi:hypothetical protein